MSIYTHCCIFLHIDESSKITAGYYREKLGTTLLLLPPLLFRLLPTTQPVVMLLQAGDWKFFGHHLFV